MGIGPVEAMLLSVLWLVVMLLAAYTVIRLGVRHGVIDADRRLGRTRRDEDR